MAIKLLTDSCSDLDKSFIEQNNIDLIALMYTIEGKDYYDDFTSISAKEFYNKIRNGLLSKTSLINSLRYDDFFRKHLDAGDDIVYIGFSSALSGSYQSSVISADELKRKYPDRKIKVIDSKCASMGEGLLVIYAALQLKKNPDFDDFVKYIEDTKLKVCHWFTVDDLHHLRRGGRVSGFTAAIAAMLSIKSILNVNNEGRLIQVTKARGRSASLNALVDEMEKSIIDEGKDQIIMISHGDCVSEAEKVADMVRKKFPLIKQVGVNMIGPVIGSHAGPGTVALFYLGTSR